MLENIAMHPLIGLLKRFKKLGLKVSDGYKPIEELIALKMVIPVTIDGNRLYEITSTGKKILGNKIPHKGRGGLEHRYFVEKIKEHFHSQEGFTYIEKDDIDLVIETVEQKLAIQVETGKSDIQGNLTKLGRYKADKKNMVATNKETEIKIKEMLKELLIPDRESINISYVKDFLKNTPAI